MSLKKSIADREFLKFREYPSTGDHVVAVKIENLTAEKVPVDIGTSAVGVAAPTGPLKRLVTTVTDVAADPIAVPLANRVALIVRNKSATETIYLGEDNTITPDNTSTGGWEIGPGEDFSLDLDESNNFYLVTSAGQTANVKILEIASSGAGGGGGVPTTLSMTQEVPSGTIDGVNATFTITSTPYGAAYFTLYLNGVYQRPTLDYSRSGSTITMVTPPVSGQLLDAIYWY